MMVLLTIGCVVGEVAQDFRTRRLSPLLGGSIDTAAALVTILALMRFPLALTAKIAAYMIAQKLRRKEKFATVLQLEPLHTCNLTCTGCGRIREYSTSLKDMMSLEDCLGAAEECEAPMVSICGGEPLIYPKIKELVAGLLDQDRIVYLCTNGMFMRREMKDYLASNYSAALEPTLARLLAEKLISEKDAETIRK